MSMDFKETLIKDMKTILTNEKISSYSKKHILDMYAWVLTEEKECESKNADNFKPTKKAKFKGCDYWTKDAFELCFTEGNKCQKLSAFKGIKHEHVVPRNVFKKYIKTVDTFDIDKIKKFFIGCVVTSKQAEKLDKLHKDNMPNINAFDEINEDVLWSRYKAARIKEIVKVSWKNKENGDGWYIDKVSNYEITGNGKLEESK